MKKQHIRLSIYTAQKNPIAYSLLDMVAESNDRESGVNYTIRDVVEYMVDVMVENPREQKNLYFEVLKDKIIISFDAGETFTLCLDWLEVQELDVNDIAGDDLAPQVSEKILENIMNEVKGENNVQEALKIINDGTQQKQS